MCEDKELEWKQQRLGKITGSNLYKIMGKTAKGLYKADRQKYMMQLIAEILTGQTTDFYKSKSMQRGNDEEFNALCAYETETGILMTPGDYTFKEHIVIKGFGASPDGYNEELGKGLELKNRDSDNHLDFLLNPVLPESAFYQCYAGIMTMCYNTWDYVSYDDRFIQDRHKIKIVTVEKDDKIVDEIEKEVRLFLAEMQEIIERLEGVE